MLIFKDFPPEIRTNDKEVKSQLITALMIMQQTVQTFIKDRIYQPDIYAIYEKFRTNINLIKRVYPGTIAKHYMKKLKTKLQEMVRPEMDASNHPILVPVEHKIVRVRVHQMVSTIRLYALTAYNKYRMNNTLRLNEVLKEDHNRRRNKAILDIADRMKHPTECKCQKCTYLDLQIRTRISVKANTSDKIMDMEQFLESNKYTRIFNTVIMKDEMMYGQNLSKLPQLEEIRHL